jgi:GxxExxY protein
VVQRDSGIIAPELTSGIIACALTVHKELGPGLLESAYSDALAHEFVLRGTPFERQKAYRVWYKGKYLGCGFRADFVVADAVVVELKAISGIEDIHIAQVNTYLKLSGCRVGLLINFNVRLLTHGIKRIIRPASVISDRPSAISVRNTSP